MAYSKSDFEVGQRVRIRQWDDMLREFGYDEYGEIDCLCSFVDDMRHLCGLEFTLAQIYPDRTIILEGENEFNYSLDMIEPLWANSRKCVASTTKLFE